MSAEDLPLSAPRALPRRFLLGAALVGATVGAAGWLGWLGSLEAPRRESFRFSRGAAFAPGEEARLRAYLADIAAEPRIAFRITGHTGTDGDGAANLALSEQRAEAARTIAAALGIGAERIAWAGGLGGDAPLRKEDGMSDREHQRSLARVEIEAFVQ